MPVIVEALLVSFGMLFIFAAAFVALFVLAITMSPIEKSISKMVWDATAPKKPQPQPKKGSFRDFSSKH